MRHQRRPPQRDRGDKHTQSRQGSSQPSQLGREPQASEEDSTCRGCCAAMAPGLFTAGAGGLCSSCSGYSTMEKAARRKVLDEHRTADTLLDEVPAAQSGQRLRAGPACFQPLPSPASKCCRGPPTPLPPLPCTSMSTVTLSHPSQLTEPGVPNPR